MIRGLGCDVCAISRMQKMMENPRFLARHFTEYEQAYLAGRKTAAQSAAGFFAAKEALVKALGTGFIGLMPGDIGVRHDENGAPCYEMGEKLAQALAARGARRAFLSISHDGDTAMAVALLEGD